MTHRSLLKDKKRIIIKLGTALLTEENGRVNLVRLERIARTAAGLREEGREVILVSSGAVGAGMGKLNLPEKPKSVAEKQALAAIGQTAILRMYETFFDEYDQRVGQVLLTRDGIEESKKRMNAKNTLNHLIKMGVIPIINENDTVATEEIEFGDNDLLSAMVADLIEADLLIILTTTNGVFTSDPSKNSDARQVSTVMKAGDDLKDIDTAGKSTLGSGGMQSKIQAAELCRSKNIDVVIANGTDPEIVKEILDGKEFGTLFVSESSNRQIKN